MRARIKGIHTTITISQKTKDKLIELDKQLSKKYETNNLIWDEFLDGIVDYVMEAEGLEFSNVGNTNNDTPILN